MDRLELFNQYRPLLLAIAYRMLGSVTDAEDVIQEVWIRWQITQSTIESPKAFLSTITTRLCIDQLRSARVQREQYVGTWLPEPLMLGKLNDFEDCAELTESLSFAFLVLIECLSPTERAVFLLREVFDYDYKDIAKIVDKSIPNCRQIFCRAHQRLAFRTTINPTSYQKNNLVEQFIAYWNQGDVRGLITLMAEDVTFWSDGGGKVLAAHKPLHGSLKVARFLAAIRCSSLIPRFASQVVQINGQSGIITTTNTKLHGILNFDFTGNNIQEIFAVVNPEKLESANLWVMTML